MHAVDRLRCLAAGAEILFAPTEMHSDSTTRLLTKIAADGYALIEHAITPEHAASLADQLTRSLQTDQEQGAPLASRGMVYAARNPLEVIDDVAALWKQTTLGAFLNEILGPDFGLVRGLFFDKPPGRSWWLPWHKDLTIAVQNNQLPSERFKSPTNKAGVPHVIAPAELLQQMLTIRLHLDDVTLENGPLRVIPGSHLSAEEIDSGREPVTIQACAGDALAMRPMLSHASGDSLPETQMHRRILHLEFAKEETLPDGYGWQRFIR